MLSEDDFDEIFNIRSILSNITIEDVDQQSMVILSSPYCQSMNKLSDFFDTIFLFASIRPKQIQTFCTLTMNIYSAREDNPLLENVKNILINKFHDLGPPSTNPVISCGYFGYLHMCFIQFLLSDEEIVEEINKFVNNHPGDKNHILFICSWFLPEIERLNNDLFKLITHNYVSKLPQDNENHHLVLKNFYKAKSIEKLRAKDWSLYRELIFSAYEPNSLGDAIRSDDFDKFKVLTNKFGFDINARLPPSLFLQIPFLQDSPTLIQAAAFFGSLQIFKFLILNDADLSLTDSKKRPLSFFAVAGGSSEIIRTCEQKRLSLKNSTIYAIEFQHQDIFNWLLDTLPNDMIPELILQESSKWGNLELVYDLLVSNLVFSYSDFKFNDFILRIRYENYLTISSIEAVKGDYSHILEILIETINKNINLNDFTEEEEEEEAKEEKPEKIIQRFNDDDYSDLSDEYDEDDGHLHNLRNQINIQLNGRRININQNNRNNNLVRTIPPNDPHVYRQFQYTDIMKKNILKDLINTASKHNSIKCLKILCKELDNDVYFIDNNNMTPLHNAAKNGYLDFIQYLLECNQIGVESHPGYKKYDINGFANYVDENNNGNDQCTPLYLAVLYGHTNVVKYLLDKGAYFGDKARQYRLQYHKLENLSDSADSESDNTNDQNSTDELHIAAREGYIQILKLFLNLNPEINNIDNDGATALHYAAGLGQLDSVNLLLSTPGVDPNNSNNESSVTPLSLACNGGHYKVVKAFIDFNKRIKEKQKNESNNDNNDDDGETKIQPILVDVNKTCQYGRPAIFNAIESRSIRTVKALLEADDIKINIHEEMNDSTPLHLACELGLTDIVKAILRQPGVDINSCDKNMNTPLHIASDRGFAQIVKLILSIEDTEEEKAKKLQEKKRKQEIKEKRKQQQQQQQENDNNNNNNDNDNNNNNKAEEEDNNDDDDDDEENESNGNSPEGQKEEEEEEEDSDDDDETHQIPKLVVNINAVNSDKRTALHFASMNDKNDCLDLLLKYKSPNESELIDVNCHDSKGNTPLMYASIYDNYYSVFNLLRIERTDVLATNEENWTALHFAASKDNDDVIQLLLIRIKSIESSNSTKNDEDQNLHHSLINLKTNGGYTALHLAAAKKAEAAMRVLLEEEEVDVNARCKNNKTPLHFAATYGFVSGVKMLLNHIPIPEKSDDDDNAYLKDDLNMTPLMYAQKYKRQEVIKLFEKREKDKGNQK